MATQSPYSTAPEGINIEAWTESAAAAVPLSTASVSASIAAGPPIIRWGASVNLDITLDAEAEKSQIQQRREAKELKARILARDAGDSDDEGIAPTGYVRRQSGGEPRRRDSMKRREALLKGKEGSRRRQKWENDRLLGNPAFQPPEPYDWAPHPTHRVQNVPYVLAPLWDRHYAAESQAREEKAHRAAITNDPSRQVPRELREKMKRARGAKALLQDLEEQVRDFVKDWEDKQRLSADGWEVAIDDTSEDESVEEEVIFVGRKDDDSSDRRPTTAQRQNEKLLFESLLEEQGASFGRWLVHTIASYYNLDTWSRTIGDPARREAYIGIPDVSVRTGTTAYSHSVGDGSLELPRPLWVMV